MSREGGGFLQDASVWELGAAHRRYEHRNHQFETIAIPHVEYMYRYALRLSQDQEDAMALLHDTYLKAHRFWDSFHEGSDIRPWLCRIMRNAFVNSYRWGRGNQEYQVPEAVRMAVSRVNDNEHDCAAGA
jgi:DNA-directed RNA polymerase specialized sigma24 family protein